ncbi:MAG: DUF4234 domain-containing protein [Clostridia bacterium]|nr:DUF4234 domain-containing protein [Clostridia bacterium]
MKRIKDDYSIATYIFLGLITFGIYDLWCIYRLIKDVNLLCEEYGKRTTGFITYILLSLVTCGLYSIFWWYRVGDMLEEAVRKRGLTSNVSGKFVLICMVLNYFVCNITSYIGIHKIFEATNELASDYNVKQATANARYKEADAE